MTDHNELLTNAAFLYLLGLLVAPALPRGPLRRAGELLYAPMRRLGLWWRWSMFAPEVPVDTRLAVPGVVFEDGSFEAIAPEGFDDGHVFGNNGGLRMIALQWALCDPVTDHMKASVCERAYELWIASPSATTTEPSQRQPVGLELRMVRFPLPAPGEPDEPGAPDVSTLWAQDL